MTAYVGGIRARFVHDSLYRMLHTSLNARGWFNPGRQHQPIQFLPEEVDDATPIAVNTIVLVDGTMTNIQAEMGSLYSDNRSQYYIDIYAEDRALGIDLSRDIKDILEGRIASIGRTGPVFDVYDFTMATPAPFTYCEIENVVVDRSHNMVHPWQKHYYSVACTVVDSYGDEDD